MIGVLVSHLTQRAKAGPRLWLHVASSAFFENEIVPPGHVTEASFSPGPQARLQPRPVSHESCRSTCKPVLEPGGAGGPCSPWGPCGPGAASPVDFLRRGQPLRWLSNWAYATSREISPVTRLVSTAVSKTQSHLQQCQRWRICRSLRCSVHSGAIM
jgi:hypothetical protein